MQGLIEKKIKKNKKTKERKPVWSVG